MGTANHKLIGKLVLVAAGMFAFGFAMIPAYSIFCEITGLQGRLDDKPASQMERNPQTNREVTIEFVSTVNNNGPWEFRPSVAKMRIHPGEIYTTTFEATNRTKGAVVGQASYNVSPGRASRYLAKPDCFCFTEQAFDAGEQRKLPVTFYVTPDLPEDVHTLTLSYTFFDVTGEVQVN